MTGVRITALYYELNLPEGAEYQAGTEREVILNGFSGTVRATGSRFVPDEMYPSVERARDVLDPQLEAWRLWTKLQSGTDWLPFQFSRAEQEPWPPPPPGSAVMVVGTASITLSGMTVRGVHAINRIPDLPPPFTVDDVVRVGRELLALCAAVPGHETKFVYPFQSLLEDVHGRRTGAAKALNVDEVLLFDLGDLSTFGGAGAVSRKHSGEPRIAYTPQCREWLLTVFRELVRRQGQWAARAVPKDAFSLPPVWPAEPHHWASKLRSRRLPVPES